MSERPEISEPQPGFFHEIRITVLPADIDVNGHANNAVYLRWVQEAATAHWFAALPAEVTATCLWYVTRQEVDYRKPAREGDVLRVRTWVAAMSAVTSERRCRIYREGDGALLAEARTLWCAINPGTGRPQRVDPRIPAALLPPAPAPEAGDPAAGKGGGAESPPPPPAVVPEEGRYAARGVSASKTEVHAVVDKLDPGLFPGAFCKITEDFLTGSPRHCNLTHSDGSGTKSILAYLWWRETGDASVFRGIAQDSVVMNVDDLLCAGVTGRVLLSSTINRNARAIPGAVLGELIAGTEAFLEFLRSHGLDIRSGGGETADVGDLTATLTVDSTATAVLERDAVVDASRIRPGMDIVALASGGVCAYDPEENSGIGSNGLTSARHELLARHYAEKYPETYDHATPPALAYCGPYRLSDPLPGSPLCVGRALLSPTRTYAPFVLSLIRELGPRRVAGLVHCSGGALTKSLRFGAGVHFVKDNLHPVPPVFAAIQKASGTGAREMHKVYNMGQRLEVYCAPADTPRVLALAGDLGIAARVSGHVESSKFPDARNHITIKTGSGEILQYA
ncbi:MAG: thioesterase family protein [Puniceicoccales bacterium]|jgi:phosphoribosylformylglycinamidine cyclo-ligase|nr:thioesterase family protein [Puniceicoccales bacterium]